MPPKVREPVTYRKLAPSIVQTIYTSHYKRSWLAQHYETPPRHITLICRSPSLEEAVREFGH